MGLHILQMFSLIDIIIVYGHYSASKPVLGGEPQGSLVISHYLDKFYPSYKFRAVEGGGGGKTVKPYQAPSLKKAPGMVLHAPFNPKGPPRKILGGPRPH